MNAMVNSNMRISGLASGMDIDQMVKDLMKANRRPLDKLNQNKTQLEWQRDAYRNVNTKMLEFRNLMFDMKLDGSFTSRKAVSSNDSAISVSGTSTADEGTYQIKVTQLAESASLKSSGSVGAKALLGLDTPLSGLNLGSDTTLTIGGEKGTATIQVKMTDTVDTIVKAVNGASSTTGVKLSYDATLDHFFFTSSGTGAAAQVKLQSENSALFSDVLKITPPGATTTGTLLTGATTFADGIATKVNGSLTADQQLKIAFDGAVSEFMITSTTTIGSLISQINNSDVGKKGMSAYIDANKKLAFTNPADNAVKPITITDETSDGTNILASLGVQDAGGVDSLTSTARNYYEVADTGVNATIEFNGVTGSYATNSFSINGMNFTAKQTMVTEANITITQDTDAIYDKIKGFVDKYNELIDATNKTLDEKRYRDFLPLTDEQKETMKEDDIKRWEEKAKSGMLRGDQMIASALNGFRTAISSVVSGLPSDDLKQLSQIGIVTGNYAEKGKLYIDPTALKKAIAEHPEEVAAMFTADDKNSATSTGDGIATRLVEQTDALMAKLKTKAGTVSSVDTSYTIGKRMREYDKRIDDMNDRLEALETKYYNQFTAMEKYINQMNAQSAYLSQQFGGG